MIFWQILEFKIENLPFFWFSRENGLLWHLSRYDIIYSVVAPILATERGCVYVSEIISFLVSVLASVVGYYICKWLDGDDSDN